MVKLVGPRFPVSDSSSPIQADSAEPRDDFATSRESHQASFVTVSNRFAEQKFHRHFRIAFCARKCDPDEKKDRGALAVEESIAGVKLELREKFVTRKGQLFTYSFVTRSIFPLIKDD